MIFYLLHYIFNLTTLSATFSCCILSSADRKADKKQHFTIGNWSLPLCICSVRHNILLRECIGFVSNHLIRFKWDLRKSMVLTQ